MHCLDKKKVSKMSFGHHIKDLVVIAIMSQSVIFSLSCECFSVLCVPIQLLPLLILVVVHQVSFLPEESFCWFTVSSLLVFLVFCVLLALSLLECPRDFPLLCVLLPGRCRLCGKSVL